MMMMGYQSSISLTTYSYANLKRKWDISPLIIIMPVNKKVPIIEGSKDDLFF